MILIMNEANNSSYTHKIQMELKVDMENSKNAHENFNSLSVSEKE